MAMIRAKRDPLGKEVGEQLANFTDHAEKEFGAQLGFIPKRCASCAFTKGTFPNESLNSANALKCAMEGKEFYCHHKIDGQEPLCAGWILLQNGKTTEAPWDYIEGADKPDAK